jgi:hypothetical protein
MTDKEKDLLHFQIFGSQNSQDVDIMVFVDKIDPQPIVNHNLVKELNTYYEEVYFPKRKINCNLCTYDFQLGTIKNVFKGTPDEVNNSLYYTYDFHIQHWNNLIVEPVKRDFDYKLIRTVRAILSFFSREETLREKIKSVLKEDHFGKRVDVLSEIDFTKFGNYTFPDSKGLNRDVWKTLAYQIGICLLLDLGVEIYDKDGLIEYFPKLEIFINRNDFLESDLKNLNGYFHKFIKLCEENRDKLETVSEKEFDLKYKI